jgi:hypothetical protein
MVAQTVQGVAMIDTSAEKLEFLAQVARSLPSQRNGRPVHPGTLVRWILVGVCGPDGSRVKLAACRVGGRWATSRAALDRFSAALTPHTEAMPLAVRTPSQRQRASERAAAELEKLGI